MYWTSTKKFIRRTILYYNIRAITFIVIFQDEEIQRTRNVASRYSATKSGVNDCWRTSAQEVWSRRSALALLLCPSPRTVRYCSVYRAQGDSAGATASTQTRHCLSLAVTIAEPVAAEEGSPIQVWLSRITALTACNLHQNK